MRVGVVGGGITGLFTALYLERSGAEVTLFEAGTPGGRSTHAAGIIEATTAYRTNTFDFLRRALRLWRAGTLRYRRADTRWLIESARILERAPAESMEGTLLEMGRDSMRAYQDLADQADDFGFAKRGLLETFDDPIHFEEERDLALSRKSVTPVEVREVRGTQGGLFFPEVAWLDTDQFVSRILREIHGTKRVTTRVKRVALDGTVWTSHTRERFDSLAVSTGVAARSLGIPLTGVKGYGWHLRTSTHIEVATIAVDRGIALVPLRGSVKATGGWDFDLSPTWSRADQVLEAIRRLIAVESVIDFSEGSRPCTPDGLPTVGRRERMVMANGGFRLGWSFAPSMGKHAALLCLGREDNQPFLSRFCRALRSGEPA